MNNLQRTQPSGKDRKLIWKQANAKKLRDLCKLRGRGGLNQLPSSKKETEEQQKKKYKYNKNIVEILYEHNKNL